MADHIGALSPAGHSDVLLPLLKSRQQRRMDGNDDETEMAAVPDHPDLGGASSGPGLGGANASSQPALGGTSSGSALGDDWQTDERCPEGRTRVALVPRHSRKFGPPFRVGSDRKLDGGIYRMIQARGRIYYILIEDVP